MENRDTLIRTYVLEEITIKLSGVLRKAGFYGFYGDMKREVEKSTYWPITHSVRRPKESIERNVKLAK